MDRRSDAPINNRILLQVQNPSGLVLMRIVVKITHYISIYLIFEYFIQDNIKYPRIKKIHHVPEKITRIDQKVNIHCVLLSHELLSTKIYYTSICIFHILFISRQVQKFKNYQNPTNMSKDIYKTIYIILFKLISIGDSFEFKATREMRLI